MSSSIYKANFIQMSEDDVKVIDANALVAKKLEMYNALMQQKQEPIEAENATETEDSEGFTSIDISDLVTEVITSDEVTDEIDEEISESARQILDNAQAEADNIRNLALQEADDIRNNAYEEGKAQGYADGSEAANRALEAAYAELNEEREKLYKEFEQEALAVEPRLVEAITRIYENVFSDSFYNHKDVVAHLIHSALMNSETDNGGSILVSEDDIDLIEESKDKIFAHISNADEWDIKISPKLSKGQIKVETAKGIVDCGIDTQLKELSRTLRALSYEA